MPGKCPSISLLSVLLHRQLNSVRTFASYGAATGSGTSTTRTSPGLVTAIANMPVIICRTSSGRALRSSNGRRIIVT